MKLTSPAFEDGGRIPARYTCEGDDVSPPLRWGDVPEGTASLVLLVTDPDAKDFVHWLLKDIPSTATELPEGAGDTVGTPVSNDFGNVGWGGPCPPSGIHQYRFCLYALSASVRLPNWADTAAVLRAIEGRVLAQAELRAVFKHGGAPDLGGSGRVGAGAGRSDAPG
jgi:Raf kinase inhibitor-like YbhB/YbcL family protein